MKENSESVSTEQVSNRLPIDSVHHMDCLDGLKQLGASTVSLVFADLPYGRTQNHWDRLVPIGPLWEELRRVGKPACVYVFTAMQPFTSLLVMSNLDWFRYSMIWRKNKSRGFLNAKKQPLRAHEDIVVFYGKQPHYSPQKTSGHPPVHAYTKHTSDGSNYGATKQGVRGGGSTSRYPTSVLEIAVVNNDDPIRVHPTQKPIALPAWFVRAYTKPGEVVLDPTCGSGSTLRAARSLGRRYVGFETDEEMVRAARKAIQTDETNQETP